MFYSSNITPFYQRRKDMRIPLPAPLSHTPASIIGIVAGCRSNPSAREILFPISTYAPLSQGPRPLHGLS